MIKRRLDARTAILGHSDVGWLSLREQMAANRRRSWLADFPVRAPPFERLLPK
jgi:hypothetical protein